jgi:hypothetical protein
LEALEFGGVPALESVASCELLAASGGTLFAAAANRAGDLLGNAGFGGFAKAFGLRGGVRDGLGGGQLGLPT